MKRPVNPGLIYHKGHKIHDKHEEEVSNSRAIVVFVSVVPFVVK